MNIVHAKHSLNIMSKCHKVITVIMLLYYGYLLMLYVYLLSHVLLEDNVEIYVSAPAPDCHTDLSTEACLLI